MPGQTARENGKKGGRPKGSKSKATLKREAVIAAFRDRVMSVADQLLDAQLSLSKGQTFLYKIEKEKVIGPKGGVSYKNKKPVLVTNQEEIERYLERLVDEGDMDDENDPGDAYYYITTKEPNNMAIDSMLDRTFGKPVNAIELTGKDGERLLPIPLLDNIRKQNVSNNNSIKKDNSAHKENKSGSGWNKRK
jgi:hypothetical protein